MGIIAYGRGESNYFSLNDGNLRRWGAGYRVAGCEGVWDALGYATRFFMEFAQWI